MDSPDPQGLIVIVCQHRKFEKLVHPAVRVQYTVCISAPFVSFCFERSGNTRKFFHHRCRSTPPPGSSHLTRPLDEIVNRRHVGPICFLLYICLSIIRKHNFFFSITTSSLHFMSNSPYPYVLGPQSHCPAVCAGSMMILYFPYRDGREAIDLRGFPQR